MQRIFIFLFLFIQISVNAQFNEDEKLAAQYFNDKQYEKAADVYEDLLKKQNESVYYYDNLLQCYIKLNDIKSAEKLIDKRVKKYPENYVFLIDKGNLYHTIKDFTKRDVIFNEILKKPIKSYEMAENILNGFIKRGFTEEAIKTILNARKQLNEGNVFVNELSALYFSKGLKKEATEELVSILNDNEFVMQEVKNTIAAAYKRSDYSILSNILLMKLQSSPQVLSFNDLLIWSYIQQKDWDGAIIQSKAIDKRFKEDGLWQMNLGYTLVSNEAYSFALRCFTDVKNLGTDKRFYFQAQQGILLCGLNQLKLKNSSDLNEIKLLEKEYLEFIQYNGVNLYSSEQIKQLADIYIYYLHDTEKGIKWLKDLMAIRGIQEKTIAECKLSLGDAYLISGDSWEADLLYKQVEKSYSNDPLGQEAKFRYAKLCYYRAEFEWAQTQLDVLKEATTQLISNNAMKLWLIIQDNTGLDSTEEALAEYSKADLLIFQNKNTEALGILENISIKFPNHSLEDEILFAKARISENEGKNKDAEVFYLKIIKDFSFDILADNALLNLAKLYEFKLNDTANAKKMYEFLILNYTGSLFTNEARLRYRFLRGDIKEEDNNNYWEN